MLKIVFIQLKDITSSPANSSSAKFTAFWQVFKENNNQDVISKFVYHHAATQHIGNIPKLFL